MEKFNEKLLSGDPFAFTKKINGSKDFLFNYTMTSAPLLDGVSKMISYNMDGLVYDVKEQTSHANLNGVKVPERIVGGHTN
jgi:hypothetical protein